MAATSITQTRPGDAGIAGSLRMFSILGVILAGGVFLRLYNLQPFAWVPDQYERLIEAKELLSGELPDSVIYPPGVTLLLAPFVALLGPTEGTMQAMTIVFSLALVPVAYLWVWRTTSDRLAATLLAGACAAAPAFLEPARGGSVDSVVTLLVVVALLLVPSLKGRGVLAFLGYGLLLALLFNIRPTNVFLVAPLVVYWLTENGVSWRPMAVARALLSKELIAVGVALALPCAVSVLAGNWYGGAYGGLLSFDQFSSNLTEYWRQIVATWLGLLLLCVPVAVGLVELWRTRRPLALGLVSFLAIWPVVHSPFLFAAARYMEPAVVAWLFLAATGVSAAFAGRKLAARKIPRVWCIASLPWFCLLLGLGSAFMVVEWDDQAAQSDAGLAAEMKPVLRELPREALMISAVTRAFSEDDFSIEYADLFDQAVEFKDKQAGVSDLGERTRSALAAGRQVYYLYSHMEADNRIFGGVWDSFRAYFDGLDEDFEMTEVHRTQHRRGGKEPWVLFQVSESGPADNAAPPGAPVEGTVP